MNSENLAPSKSYQPVLLIVLDGFGLGTDSSIDAIAQARKPFIDSLYKTYPWTPINASSEDVGLPMGQMGNSEVGHMNIGAGRVVYQEITRINRSIRMGDFFDIHAFLGAIEAAKSKENAALHLVGLVSDGGVHSMNTHLYALLQLAKNHGVSNVRVHAMLDGRDTPPESGATYVQDLKEKIVEIGIGEVATVMGRYYGMDRDNRWERTEKAYRALTEGIGKRSIDPVDAIRSSYSAGVTDEFMEPVVIENAAKQPIGLIRDGDAFIFFNFRTDRTRQLTRAFIDDSFDKFQRQKLELYFATMTRYHDDFSCPVAFPPSSLKKTLGEVISDLGLHQLHLAETEKYAHVTFFFNGGREDPFPNEDRVLVPSPRGVATYDQKPEMSAFELTEHALRALSSGGYSFIVMNFANADMVGHSGKMDAAIRAVEVVDECVTKVVQEALGNGFVTVITADHGNADKMVDADGGPHTAHTTNWVPFILVGEQFKGKSLRKEGRLSDIAPTLLRIMGIPIPKEMDGVVLMDSL